MDKIQEDSQQNALIIQHLRQQCDAQQRDQKRLLEQIVMLIEALQKYGQHSMGCLALKCHKCDYLDSNYIHHNIGNLRFHLFTPGSCTCGLEAALLNLSMRITND